MPSCFGTTPDYRRIQAAFEGKLFDRVPLYEFFCNMDVQMAAVGDHPMNDPLPFSGDEELDKHIKAQYYLGYDYLYTTVGFMFQGMRWHAADDNRHFLDDDSAPIKNRKDFENYRWPKPDWVDYSCVEKTAKHLPEGMKLVVNLGGGLLEWAMWLMGTEHFLMTMYDDPELINDLIKRINDQQVAVALNSLDHPDVIAATLGDDMGFKTQTFLPPQALRDLIFPGLKAIVDAVHSKGKRFILHSCGNLDDVMDDLIDYVGIDAKHSYEDAITPVTEAKQRWGDRVAIIGGVDVDMICRASEADLRKYVRNIVEVCGKGGGYALGSGNSVPDYMPAKSLRIMNDEAIRCQM